MAYSKQTWVDGSPSSPLSAARLGHIENGVHQASQAAEFAYTAVQGRLSQSAVETTIRTVISESPVISQSPPASGFGGLVRAMRQGAKHLNWLHIGDSTSAPDWTYPRKVLAAHIAPAFPHLRIEYVGWSDTTGWLTGEVIQWGSGSSPKTFRLYNLSVAGKNLAYVQGSSRWAAAIGVDPDAISVAHGFNEAATPGVFRGRLMGVIEALRAECPQAECVIVAQNPHRDNDTNTLRMVEAARVAQWLGVGFADVTSAFLRHANMSSLFPAEDPVHPNGAGVDVAAAELAKQFVTPSDVRPSPQGVSGFARLGQNLTPAGAFTGWDGTGTPAGTTKTSSLTLAKDTTDYETGGFSVRADATAASQFLSITVDARAFRGRWVTVAARIKSTSGAVGSASAADGATSVNSFPDADSAGAWRWAVAQVKVSPVATSVIATVNVTTAGVTSGTVRIDRIVTCLGPVPYDAIP